MKTRLFLMFLAVGLVCTGAAMAINVPDGDFDTPDIGDGNWDYLSNMGGAWSATGGGTSGSPWVGNNYSYAGYDYPGMGHTGAQWVDLNADYIHQKLGGVTYEEGVTYELSVWATTGTADQGLWLYFLDATESEDGWSGAITLNKEEGSNDPAFIPVPVSDWEQYSAQYTATAADAGRVMGIAIYGYGSTYADTVTLTPEPMTLGLLGVGALMIRRRKR